MMRFLYGFAVVVTTLLVAYLTAALFAMPNTEQSDTLIRVIGVLALMDMAFLALLVFEEHRP